MNGGGVCVSSAWYWEAPGSDDSAAVPLSSSALRPGPGAQGIRPLDLRTITCTTRASAAHLRQ
ncbi:hypothetical protein E2C01_032259 [Portunus trituberculatus]|uniref:Uncharacterized protein n=1 Tax=Portunus trituberculatus TaxID=210409 RepID=A0A5B7F046_PORTR|nr:hypothetical protein [Portunus trituberculatus]